MIGYTPLAIRVVRTTLFACLCMTLGHAAMAADEQTRRIEALERRLETSLRMIERLSARVVQLERANSAAAPASQASAQGPAPATPSEQAQAIAALQESVNQISDGLSKQGNDTGVPLHGFADVGAAWSGGPDPTKQRGFNGGSLDIYLTPKFNDRTKMLLELVVEYEPDGAQAVDMERLQIGYTFGDALTLWMGRFHTPFGMWNTSFHHGANLQTSISRPRFIEFEDKGGIIPAHSIGLWANGKTALGSGKLAYDGYLSNGQKIRDRSLDFNAFTDDSSGKMIGLNVGYRAGGPLTGLSVGAHAFASTVRAYSNSGAVLNATRVRAGGGYFGYDADDWEAIGEYYRFANADVNANVSRSSSAWFVQVGKAFGSLTPFARYERASLDPADNYFLSQATGRSYRRIALGARYALSERTALKFELSNTSESAVNQLDETGTWTAFPGATYRRGAVQYSIAF